MSAKQEAKEEIVQEKPAPGSRGRPAGSKDNKATNQTIARAAAAAAAAGDCSKRKEAKKG